MSVSNHGMYTPEYHCRVRLRVQIAVLINHWYHSRVRLRVQKGLYENLWGLLKGSKGFGNIMSA